jgi:hypothetical protein
MNNNRDTVKFELDGKEHELIEFELYAVPTIIESQRIKGEAAGFTSNGFTSLVELENARDSYLEKCILRDKKGNKIPGELPGTVKLDTSAGAYRLYINFKELIESAYFYGKMKVLLIKAPEGFELDSLSTEEFTVLRSAFEVALESFCEKKRGKSGAYKRHNIRAA